MNSEVRNNRERITSIDALRAVTLLGILFVHVMDIFGWGHAYELSGSLGLFFIKIIHLFVSNRCNTIFAVLFGVSFYLILRNPKNTTGKFVWRCFILVFIGIFNKIFYSYDALMWYGIWGMFLACFRNLSIKRLWMAFIVLFILNTIISYSVDMKDLFFGTNVAYHRYQDSESFRDVLNYPIWMSIMDYFRAVIAAPLGCLSKFLLGYCIAKSGIIENLKNYVTVRIFVILTVLHIVFYYLVNYMDISHVKTICYYCGAFSYAELFLLLYYKSYPYLRFLEPYGKLGLTNYSMQGIMGVCLTWLVFLPYHFSFEMILLVMFCFYVVQVLFSICWLRYFKYGPFEWIWRCVTEKQMLKNRI